jgi:hypothetical protein
MSILSNLFGRATKVVRNAGRRTRKFGRNYSRLALRVAKPVTNAVGLTRRRGRPHKKRSSRRQRAD